MLRFRKDWSWQRTVWREKYRCTQLWFRWHGNCSALATTTTATTTIPSIYTWLFYLCRHTSYRYLLAREFIFIYCYSVHATSILFPNRPAVNLLLILPVPALEADPTLLLDRLLPTAVLPRQLLVPNQSGSLSWFRLQVLFITKTYTYFLIGLVMSSHFLLLSSWLVDRCYGS